MKNLHPIPPMLSKSGLFPADIDNWAFEIKWDGIRVILYYQNRKSILLSRNLLDISLQYPEIAAFQPAPHLSSLILDGEIIATDENGHPSFSLLQHRMGLSAAANIAKMQQRIPVTYMIFDLLELNGQSLLNQTFSERRKQLAQLTVPGEHWQVSPYHANGKDLQEACRRLGLEGIVAKRLDSPYLPGKRPGTWIKIKNQRRQELIIGGWTAGKGKRRGKIGALLVGYYDQAETGKTAPKLHYAGSVGTGFTESLLDELYKRLSPLCRESNPFEETPPKLNTVQFVNPVLVGEFEFTEWTPALTLRHPSFKGLRFDKNPRFVVREPG